MSDTLHSSEGSNQSLKIKRLGRFRGRDAFLEHRKSGAKRIHTSVVTLFVGPPKKSGQRHLAAVAAKRLGDAHLRHRIRRRIKAAFSQTVTTPCSVICYAKEGAITVSYEELCKTLEQINDLKELQA